MEGYGERGFPRLRRRSRVAPPSGWARGRVFFGRHMARRELWDKPEWTQKPRPCDEGTANGVNAALAMQSHVDCFTLDRFAHTAAAFMQQSRSHGYAGGFACVGTTRPTGAFGEPAGSAP